ncbi:MAG: NAD-dependent deacylase [Candidatus Thermoplasmatota archaeon]|nr:NAD-dependent deacylase [Candidatus Thermoplasmatota archaeon]
MAVSFERGRLELPVSIRERIQAAKTASVLTGSGVSAESGVPTFRGADGVWSKYDWRVLATREGFRKDPRLVWEWYQLRQIEIAKAKPNAAHETIADMERHFGSFAVLTQNIDGLHARAGSKRIVELHGNIWRMRCERDGTVITTDEPVKKIPPLCQCGAILRPDVVWFGEQLPETAAKEASEVARTSDVMFVVGTSAVVYPAAALPIIAKNSGGLVVEVNTEPTDISAHADLSVIGRAGEVMPVLWQLIA